MTYRNDTKYLTHSVTKFDDLVNVLTLYGFRNDIDTTTLIGESFSELTIFGESFDVTCVFEDGTISKVVINDDSGSVGIHADELEIYEACCSYPMSRIGEPEKPKNESELTITLKINGICIAQLDDWFDIGE